MSQRWQQQAKHLVDSFFVLHQVLPVATAASEEQAASEELAVSGTDRIRRQQILREAEGYLDLAVLFNDEWPLSDERRCQLAGRAVASLDRLRGSAVESPDALFLRGQAFRTMNRFAEALSPLEQAAQLDPKNIHIWLALGWCYKRVNRLDMAIEALEAAKEEEPDAAILYYNLACYWSLARNNRKAIDFLEYALKLDGQYRLLINAETDFDPIRNDPEFRALTSVIV